MAMVAATAFSALLLMLLASAPAAQAVAQPTSTSLTVDVYADGSVAVTQLVSANSSDVSIDLHLLTSVLTDAIAVDQNGSPLSFQISGTNITVYTLGATGVALRYDSDALTDKQGTVWTLNFTTAYNATIVLPQGSTVTAVSGTPASFSEQGTSPVIDVPPGGWQVSYGLPVSIPTTSSSSTSSAGSSTSVTTSFGQTSASSGSTSSAQASSTGSPTSWIGLTYTDLAAGVLVVAVVLASLFLLRRRAGPSLDLGSTDLRPDDVQVLNFIAEKGGKVFEPEIRTRFALPKTSAWRQIKRLERLGYVKTTKVGSQNQVEIVKDREKSEN